MYILFVFFKFILKPWYTIGQNSHSDNLRPDWLAHCESQSCLKHRLYAGQWVQIYILLLLITHFCVFVYLQLVAEQSGPAPVSITSSSKRTTHTSPLNTASLQSVPPYYSTCHVHVSFKVCFITKCNISYLVVIPVLSSYVSFSILSLHFQVINLYLF